LIIKEMLNLKDVDSVAISSVVPDITTVLKEMCVKHLNINPLIVGPGVKTGVGIIADNPREVGADLICDVAGVFDEEALIIDLGTATKYIYAKNKTLRGVVISPGVGVSIKALSSNAALLPEIEIKTPSKVLGNNTINCMQSGVTYGVASQVDGMIERIREEVKNPNLKVIATGGLANLIIPLTKHEITIDNLLTLRGLFEVYRRNL
jgi:type III pantothenate kinase